MTYRRSAIRGSAERDGDLAWLMMLDALIFQAEAEARWLELCEARLALTRSQPRPAGNTDDGAADDAGDGAGAVRQVERTL